MSGKSKRLTVLILISRDTDRWKANKMNYKAMTMRMVIQLHTQNSTILKTGQTTSRKAFSKVDLIDWLQRRKSTAGPRQKIILATPTKKDIYWFSWQRDLRNEIQDLWPQIFTTIVPKTLWNLMLRLLQRLAIKVTLKVHDYAQFTLYCSEFEFLKDSLLKHWATMHESVV